MVWYCWETRSLGGQPLPLGQGGHWQDLHILLVFPIPVHPKFIKGLGLYPQDVAVRKSFGLHCCHSEQSALKLFRNAHCKWAKRRNLRGKPESQSSAGQGASPEKAEVPRAQMLSVGPICRAGCILCTPVPAALSPFYACFSPARKPRKTLCASGCCQSMRARG